MKALVLAAAMVIGAMPVAAAEVQTAEGDWSNLPELRLTQRRVISPIMVGQIHNLIVLGECSIPGQNKKKLDMTVPFAAQFAPDGALERVVMKPVGCAKAESILGGQVVEMIANGTFKATGANSEGWYKGEISFSSQT